MSDESSNGTVQELRAENAALRERVASLEAEALAGEEAEAKRAAMQDALREKLAAAEAKLRADTALMNKANEALHHMTKLYAAEGEKLAVAIEALRRVSSEHQDYSSVATSESEDSRQYSIGVVDGHRCAAGTARDTLKKLGVE